MFNFIDVYFVDALLGDFLFFDIFPLASLCCLFCNFSLHLKHIFPLNSIILSFHRGCIGARPLFQCKVSDVRYCTNEPALIIKYLFVLLPFLADQRKHLRCVLLPQTQQLVEVLHLIAYAQLIIALLYVAEHQVHQLSEHFLRVNCLQHAVTHQSHHQVQRVLVFHLHLD